MAFNLEDYEPVADRIEKFWADNQDGRMFTELVYHDEQRYIVKASVWRWGSGLGAEGATVPPTATGYAEETIGSTNVNRTSALENCETSAIGRALANLGYAVKGQRPSREEMAKAQPEPRQRSGGRRGPTESPQTVDVPSQGNGTDPVKENLRRIQLELLQGVHGDKPRAQMIWRTTLETFGLSVGEEIPANMLEPIETAVKAVAL